MNKIFEPLLEYGIPGLMLIACLFAIIRLFKELGFQRKESLEERKMFYKQRSEDNKEFMNVLQDNTETLGDLKTFLKFQVKINSKR